MVNKGGKLAATVASYRIRESVIQAIPFWIASLITGLLSVGYTKLFNLSESFLHQCLQWNKAFIFLLAPVNFIFAWYVVKQFAPNARGSGIPQVMATIDLPANAHDRGVRKLLGFRIIIIKILSSILMVFGGGAIGREGPTIQIAGSVFYIVHKWIPATWSKLSKKSYYITGAAAGLAAAFNTPLGGIVFAIEELARIHVSFFRSALFSAVIIAGLTAQGMLGPYLYLGYPEVRGLTNFIFLAVIVVAGVAGIFGALMSKAILKFINWQKTFNNWKRLVSIIAISLAMAAIAYFADYNILGSGKDLMNRVLFTADKHVSILTVFSRVVGPILSFNTGAAGGVFAPSLSAGASIGACFSDLFHLSASDCNILTLAGMVGFLTGVTRTPFTSAILVLEMTDRHSVVFHLMLAALISNITAMVVDEHSFYEYLKHSYIEEATAED